jgi:MmyB-like transcription regulator ligand binding domain
MQPLRESLGQLVDALQPNPAFIVAGLWNLIEANAAASLLGAGGDAASAARLRELAAHREAAATA